eukprot:SAG31_NODE_351_length_17237_cov_7.010445_15_plen_115_part_00
MPASSTNIDAKERLRLLEQQNQKLLREVALLRQQVCADYATNLWQCFGLSEQICILSVGGPEISPAGDHVGCCGDANDSMQCSGTGSCQRFCPATCIPVDRANGLPSTRGRDFQ